MAGPGLTRADREAVGLFHERYGGLAAGSEVLRLSELLRCFARLPYENLSKILCLVEATPRPRLPLQVVSEHLDLGTGGTCFSLTELLRCLLLAQGIVAHPVMAHMRHGANIHCALRVEAGGRAFLVDPGYLLRQPLPLDPALSVFSVDIDKSVESFQPFIRPAGPVDGAPAWLPPGGFDLFTVENTGPVWRYRFEDLAPSPEAFMHYWQASFNQTGLRSLLACRAADDGQRLFLHNHKLRRVDRSGKRTDNVRLTLEQSVKETFGIDPGVTRRALALLHARRPSVREEMAHGPKR